MFAVLKDLWLLRLFRKPTFPKNTLIEERWGADFSRSDRARFNLENQDAYESSLDDKALKLEVKKASCMAWTENNWYRYKDQAIEADIRLHPQNGYSAAGILFRMVDSASYYSLLVSSKGFFRLDLVFNGSPMPLIAWSEFNHESGEAGIKADVRILALAEKISIIINNTWVGEIHDDTIQAGQIAFALASYEKSSIGVCIAWLHRFSIEARPVEVEAAYLRWNTLIRIPHTSRIRLAETFIAMGQPMSALIQLKRSWENGNPQRSQKELLLAARCAAKLNLIEEAEEYLERCVEFDSESDEARQSLGEKAKILFLAGRYAELKTYTEEALRFFPEDPTLHTLLGHAFFNAGQFDSAVRSYNEALKLEPANALITLNAATTYEKLNQKVLAYTRYAEAGNLFLAAENYSDLENVVSRLLEIDPDGSEGHALAAKRAYALNNLTFAEKELLAAKRLRTKQGLPEDPSIYYLLALLHIKKGQRKSAIQILERAVQIEPSFGLFHFRLAENIFILKNDPEDQQLKHELQAAMETDPHNGWIYNLAGQIEMARGDLRAAVYYLDRAYAILGTDVSVLANKAWLLYQQGLADEALKVLNPSDRIDPDGILANQRGNILVRCNRIEEADKEYQEALKKNPSEMSFLYNRASCLIELDMLGEADQLISRGLEIEQSVRLLELIACVATKKGELTRAEAAYRAALDMDPDKPTLHYSLCQVYLTMNHWSLAEDALLRLESIPIKDTIVISKAKDLRKQLENARNRTISCALCAISWIVRKDSPKTPVLRLVDQPPDQLPAGTCSSCGKTYCIGCGKLSMDTLNRFICPSCKVPLKFFDEGLKKVMYDWSIQSKK